MYILVAAAAAFLDQVVKYLIRTNMQVAESIPVIEGLFHITYVQNRGGAFSILEGQTVMLTVLPALLTAAILIFIYKKRRTEPQLVLLALALICGGGIGNLIDRVRFGAVVDFLDFRVFPIFNVADICVCMGCGLLLLTVLFPGRLAGRPKPVDDQTHCNGFGFSARRRDRRSAIEGETREYDA